MMGMVLLLSLDPVSERSVDRLTMAPTERRRLPEKKNGRAKDIFEEEKEMFNSSPN